MIFRHLRALVVLGMLIIVAGCKAALEKTLINLSPTVDLSGSSAEKSELVDYCLCITRIEQETQDGTHLIWTPADEPFGSVILSPGRYRVRVVQGHSTTIRPNVPVVTLSHEFVFDSEPGHTYRMHSQQCQDIPLFEVFMWAQWRCAGVWENSVFVWLKDATSGEMIEKASTIKSDPDN